MKIVSICKNAAFLSLLPVLLFACQGAKPESEEKANAANETLNSAEEVDFITAAWTQLGGAATVGAPTGTATDLPGAVGRYQTFSNGVIVWSNDHGAVLVPTAIFNHWIGLTSQRAAEDPTRTRFDYIGLPKSTSDSPAATDTVAWDSRVNFDRGIIGVAAGQVLSIEGNIFRRYAANPAKWGFPTGTAAHTNISNLKRTWIGQVFAGGEIWTRRDTAFGFVTVDLKSGPTFNAWVNSPQYGDPVSSIGDDGNGGEVGAFTGGNIYSSRLGAFGVPSTTTDGNGHSLLTEYVALGGTKSWLGYPSGESGKSPGGAVYSSFQNGLLVMYPDGSGFAPPQTFGNLSFVYDSAQDTQDPGCFGVDAFGFCIGIDEGPFMMTSMTVYQDGNSTPVAGPVNFPPAGSGCSETFIGFTLSSQSNVYCDNGQQTIGYAVPLGVAQGNKSFTVELVSEGYSADLFGGNSGTTKGHLVRDFNIDNQWGATLPHQVTAPDNGDYNFTSHVRNSFPYNSDDWKGTMWWSFQNFDTAVMPYITYVDTFNRVSVNATGSVASLLDDAYYNLVYKTVAKGGNCFGMSLDSIDALFARRSTYDEPIHQWFSGTQDGSKLDPSASASYADLAHEINVKSGYQLGVDMINYALTHFIDATISPQSTLQSVEAALAANSYPLLAITSNLLFRDGHMLRPYRVGASDVPCQWIGGSATCTQVFVLDSNIPSGISAEEQFVEFSDDNRWAYAPGFETTDYSGGFVSGGRIMYVPYSVVDHQPDTPISELAELLASAAIVILGETATVNQVTDEAGRTLFKLPISGASPSWSDLATGATAIANMAPIPLYDPAASAATIVASKGLDSTQHYDVGLAPGQPDGTLYEALFTTGLMSTDIVVPGAQGVADQLTLTKLGTPDKSVAFKVPANGVGKAINWTVTGPDKQRPVVLSQLAVQPAQELTAILENGAARLKIKNNGPSTSATISLGSATSAPVSTGTIQIPTGESGVDCSWNGATPSCVTMRPEMSSIFGFESGADWTSQGFPLSIVASPKTEGFFALQVGSSGYRELWSVPFSTSILQGIASKLTLDVYVPSGPSNPYWLGAVQLYANCPSANVYHSYQGQVELTGRPLGAFTAAIFNLTPEVVAAMQGKHTDFALGIAVNAAPAAESIVLDNLRFTH